MSICGISFPIPFRYRHVVGEGVRAQQVYREVVDFLECHNFGREERGSFHFSLRGWEYENLPEGCGKICRSLAKNVPT